MSFSAFLEQSRHRVDTAIHRQLTHYDTHPLLTEAMNYSLFNGGKRIRPILVYASANALGEANSISDKAAVAIEAIHAYSLIHDDLPAMDDDDLRRGKPTSHIAFNEATAILAGDALHTFAFEILSQTEANSHANTQLTMLQILSQASGAKGMVAGQSIDLAAVDQSLTLEQLEHMHRLKTGALINASVTLGALSIKAIGGNVSDAQISALGVYADAIGLAFQVQDDILDVTADTHTLGKQQGADAALNKPTYVSLLGLNAARQKARDLHEQALTALSRFDYRADHLRHLSAYIIQRKN